MPAWAVEQGFQAGLQHQICDASLACSFNQCRVFPDGKVQYLHPADGVYPEKVNAGRKGVNQNMRSIGENVNPIKVSQCSL
jgi:hypothetical protein